MQVVEVGSYKGEELVQFRGHVKKIVTYEPNPRKIQDITDRVKVEGLAAFTTIRNAAVTNFSGKVTLYLPNGAESQQDMVRFMRRIPPHQCTHATHALHTRHLLC